jgi:hypothetical protein
LRNAVKNCWTSRERRSAAPDTLPDACRTCSAERLVSPIAVLTVEMLEASV